MKQWCFKKYILVFKNALILNDPELVLKQLKTTGRVWVVNKLYALGIYTAYNTFKFNRDPYENLIITKHQFENG